MNSIEMNNVQFSYPQTDHSVLDISNLTIGQNEKIFLFGPSGSGKTTLLEMIAGVLVPDSGHIQICGAEIQNMSSAQRDRFRAEKIGYIFQNFNLIPYLTVIENITLPLYLSPGRRKNVSVQNELNEVVFICKELGIEMLLSKKVTELSIGQQQRVAAARALLGKPELILADEPTSALDFEHREKFIQLLFKLSDQSGSSILFVSHDRSLEKLFDRSISLAQINQAGEK